MATYYVDGSAGDDSNDGTIESPLQTLAAAVAAWVSDSSPADSTVYIKRGQTYRESFEPATPGLSVDSYGSGDYPLITGFDVATGWAAHSTEANVYELSWTHEENSAGQIGVIEDGEELLQVADAAACAATPGSCAAESTTSSPSLVWIHPSDSGDPESNGKVYEASRRLRSFLVQDGDSISRVFTSGCLQKDGAIKAGEDVNISRCVAESGNQHNFLIESGDAYRAVATGWFDDASGETAFVNFYSLAGPVEFSHESCGALWLGDAVSNTSAFYAHGSVGYPYEQALLRNCFAYKCSPFQLEDINIDGFVGRSVYFSQKAEGNANLRHVFLETDASDTSSGFQYFGVTEITDSAFICNGSNPNPMFQTLVGDSLAMRNCLIANVGSRRQWLSTKTAFTLEFEKCIWWGAPSNTGHDQWQVLAGSPEGWIDRNLYYVPGAEQIRVKVGATRYTTLTALQAATGYAANSAYLTDAQAALFWTGDIEAGDFRVSPDAECTWEDGTTSTELPDGTKLTQLGVRNPPSAWPAIPTTRSEARDFVMGHNGPWYGADTPETPVASKVLSGTVYGYGGNESAGTASDLSDVLTAIGNVPTPAENATAAAAAILATPGNKLATAADGKVTAELTSDYDAAKTAATQASVSALPDATANGTAAAAAIERADGMLKKVPKIGDQVRRVNQLNKHVDETLSEVPE